MKKGRKWRMRRGEEEERGEGGKDKSKEQVENQ